LVLVYLIAVWALITGIFELIAAIRLWHVFGSEWLLLLSAFASIAFGILIFNIPLVGAIVVVAWVAAYALIFGILLISFGLRLRNWQKRRGFGREEVVRT
jgi:uncharacterized membrane protein HdeD (DUF308 family)